MMIIPLLLPIFTHRWDILQTRTQSLKWISRKATMEQFFFPIVKVKETMIVSTRKGLGWLINKNKAKEWTLLKIIFTKIYRLRELARVDLHDTCFENDRYWNRSLLQRRKYNKCHYFVSFPFFFCRPRQWY